MTQEDITQAIREGLRLSTELARAEYQRIKIESRTRRERDRNRYIKAQEDFCWEHIYQTAAFAMMGERVPELINDTAISNALSDDRCVTALLLLFLSGYSRLSELSRSVVTPEVISGDVRAFFGYVKTLQWLRLGDKRYTPQLKIQPKHKKLLFAILKMFTDKGYFSKAGKDKWEWKGKEVDCKLFYALANRRIFGGEERIQWTFFNTYINGVKSRNRVPSIDGRGRLNKHQETIREFFNSNTQNYSYE